jgi:negative regulator of sigma E activity
MNEEALSALLDGECGPDEVDRLLDALEKSPALKAQFSRMCMARDSLQGLRPRRGLDLAERVGAALARETAPAANDARVARWPAVAGLALAAGVAAAVVFVVRPDRAPVAPAETVAAAAPAQPAAVEAADRDAAWGELGAQDARELDSYMVAHSRSRARLGQGMGGTLGYARYTAYSAKYQTADDAKK